MNYINRIFNLLSFTQYSEMYIKNHVYFNKSEFNSLYFGIHLLWIITNIHWVFYIRKMKTNTCTCSYLNKWNFISPHNYYTLIILLIKKFIFLHINDLLFSEHTIFCPLPPININFKPVSQSNFKYSLNSTTTIQPPSNKLLNIIIIESDPKSARLFRHTIEYRIIIDTRHC